MLEFRSAGESHGRGLLVFVEGLPAGMDVDREAINGKLLRRQGGYGRGGRMEIEKDRIEVISGIRGGKTMGSPVGLLIYNRDWENWQQIMAPFAHQHEDTGEIEIKKDSRIKRVSDRVTKPRPGHADLAGVIKYNLDDIRTILERASARETAARTAVGGLMDNFLAYFNIEIISHVIRIGEIISRPGKISFTELKNRVYNSPLHCYDRECEREMMAYIDSVRDKGDSLGGVIELRTTPLPPGLGSHTQWNRRLDGKMARVLMSIPAIKGVEIGPAFENAGKTGSEVHDEIYYSKEKGYYRTTNRAGGLEGGITNGEPLIIRIAMKPIPTLYKPLNSVDIATRESYKAGVERSDVTAVPAAGVVGESMVAYAIAGALLDKFGGDHIEEIVRNYRNYLEHNRHLK